MKNLGLVFVSVAVLSGCVAPPAGQFSVEERRFGITGQFASCRKLHVRADFVRIEDCDGEGPKSFTLVRPDRNRITTVDMAAGTCLDQPFDRWREEMLGGKSFSRLTGETFLALKFGAGTSGKAAFVPCKEDVGDRACREWTVTSPDSTSPDDHTTIVVADRTGLPLRLEEVLGSGKFRTRTEWSRPVAEPQPASLFEPPADCINVTDMQAFSFALANTSGTKLIGLDSVPHPEEIAKAVCDGNRVLDVRFAREQPGNPDAPARDSSHFFDILTGQVFDVVDGNANDDETCLLVTAAFLESRQPLPFAKPVRDDEAAKAPGEECAASTKEWLVKAGGRAVVRCAVLSTIAGHGRFVAVEYEPRERDFLAALVLESADRLAGMELPASGDRPAGVWRVDDDGEFEPGNFELLFALQSKVTSQIELGYSWIGAEGLSLHLIRDSGRKFVDVRSGYRYQAPM